jgi:predicted trehalose synthase
MMSQKDELKDRVEAKKKRLEAQISELKADARSTSREESARLQSKLDALGDSLKEGWDDLSETVAAKLNGWLKDD